MTLPMNFVTPSVSLQSSLFLDPHPAFGLVPLKEGTVQGIQNTQKKNIK